MPGNTAKPKLEKRMVQQEIQGSKSGIDHEAEIQIGKSRAICYNRWKSVDRAKEITQESDNLGNEPKRGWKKTD